MSDTDRARQTMEDGNTADAPCRALVPMVTAAKWSRVSTTHLSRASSTFVAHLIATADQAPQTRSLRRATPADARSAYATNQHRLASAGMLAQQVI